MQPLMTVRQRVVVAIGILIVGVLGIYVIPRMRDSGSAVPSEDSRRPEVALEQGGTPHGKTIVWGRVLGVPGARVEETVVTVGVRQTETIPTLVIGRTSQGLEIVQPGQRVRAKVRPSGV